MTVHNVYAGEAIHHVHGRVHRFRPQGRIKLHHEGKAPNPVTRISGGDYAARLFVGLNVGIVWETRKKQGALGDASILGGRVVEPSVQVIIIDLAGTGKKQFVDDMKELAEVLRKKMKQETVIIEIQRRGVVVDVYSITA